MLDRREIEKTTRSKRILGVTVRSTKNREAKSQPLSVCLEDLAGDSFFKVKVGQMAPF